MSYWPSFEIPFGIRIVTEPLGIVSLSARPRRTVQLEELKDLQLMLAWKLGGFARPEVSSPLIRFSFNLSLATDRVLTNRLCFVLPLPRLVLSVWLLVVAPCSLDRTFCAGCLFFVSWYFDCIVSYKPHSIHHSYLIWEEAGSIAARRFARKMEVKALSVRLLNLRPHISAFSSRVFRKDFKHLEAA